MFNTIKLYFLKAKISKLIKKSIYELYSENFNFNKVYSSLCKNGDDIHNICLYISMFTASELTEPFHDIFVDGIIEELEGIIPLYKSDSNKFNEMLNFYKIKAEISWLERTEKILKRKLAYKNDEYSIEGVIYRIENAKKGPTSTEERNKFKKMTLDYQKANSNYEDYINKNK